MRQERRERIYQILDLIERHLFEELNTDDLAASAYFSKYHFQRLFRSVVGNSVMKYIRARRLILAGRDICTTDSTILEIALKYRYGSNESFTRAFREYHGTNPSHYRKYGLGLGPDRMVEEYTVVNQSIHMSREIVKNLNGFIVQARQLVERIRAFCHDNPTLENFRIIAREVDRLADRIFTVKQDMDASADSSPATSPMLQTAKELDDAAFGMRIINFNFRLQMFRTQMETRKAGLDDIGSLFNELTGQAVEQTRESARLLSDLRELIHNETRDAVIERITQVRDMIEDVAKSSDGIYEYISKQTDAEDVSSIYLPVAEMATGISTECRETTRCLTIDVAPEGIDELRKLITEAAKSASYMESCMIRANVLLFSVSLDRVRTPDEQFVLKVIDLVRELATTVGKVYEETSRISEETTALMELLTVEDERRDERLEYYTWCSLLSFYTKAELAKVRHVLDPAFEPRIISVNERIEHLDAVLKTPGVSLSDVSHAMSDVSQSLLDFYRVTGDRYEPFRFLSDEYRSTADGGTSTYT